MPSRLELLSKHVSSELKGEHGEEPRRHSEHTETAAAQESPTRKSEQLLRPSAAHFLPGTSPSRRGSSSNATTPRTSLSPSRPVTPAMEPRKPGTFSLLKFRHVSEANLRHKRQAEAVPSMSNPSDISNIDSIPINRPLSKKKSLLGLLGRAKTASDAIPKEKTETPVERSSPGHRRNTLSADGPLRARVTFEDNGLQQRPFTSHAPPAYGDERNNMLATPVTRLSESSRSDQSDHGVYATTTTTHTVHTTTTFFRLPRRKKQGPLFPLPPKVIPPDHGSSLAVPTTGASSNSHSSAIEPPMVATLRNAASFSHDGSSSADGMRSPVYSGIGSHSGPSSPLRREGSVTSNLSTPPRRLTMRGRTGTLSSLRNMPSSDTLANPTIPTSTRTSISTGRKSFGDLFSLTSRLRQNSEFGQSGSVTPGSMTSKSNSMQLVREPVVVPERFDNETPATYLVRLEEAVSRGVVAAVLSKGSDSFSQQVLRSYMRGFAFYGDPMDMAIRKLLMEAELPKETQHIDRCLQSFANRYHECNPGIYSSPDQAYFIAFSLLILHTDVFNKNNKHKMQKGDYLKNTKGEGIFNEILECFYDNISYTPFIHVEDDLDINGERIIQHKVKRKGLFPRTTTDPVKKPLREPIDPYTLILERLLDELRPNLKDVMQLEEHYNYLGTASSLNMKLLLDTFFKTGVLQIKSSRSRPDAFLSDTTISNPEAANPGVVEIKVTKVGLLWRKDAKKKKARSPWSEWGAILTGAQLYFFRDTRWIRELMHQEDAHVKKGMEGIPVTFSPPLNDFKPDALMSTDNAVALLDTTYDRHKHAFVFVRHGGFEEVFLADNQAEMNDWMAKLNYASAFRTAGVRMRGILGSNYDGQRNRGMRRLGSSDGATQSVQTATGEVTIMRSRIDNRMAQDIMAARREIMLQKIAAWETKLAELELQLDAHLRNARHLQILAPIQVKTREQVLSAAARIAAQLKWLRMEAWRLRCHRDILMKDLGEEKSCETTLSKTKPLPMSYQGDGQVSRNISQTSYLGSASSLPRPTSHPTSQSEVADVFDDIFTSVPAVGSDRNFTRAQASWELPPLAFDDEAYIRNSITEPITTFNLAHTSSFPNIRQAGAIDPRRAVSSPMTMSASPVDADEQEVLQDNGLMQADAADLSSLMHANESPASTPDRNRHESRVGSEKAPASGEREKSDKSKIRRSLHRTLRETHVPGSSRNKKHRDPSSTSGMDASQGAEDVLARGAGSFTVHGKKASVITFGEEFSNMSPDERLRIKRNAHRGHGGTGKNSALSNDAIEDRFQSVLAEPILFREREPRESDASTSTATARSFQELHKRLSAHAASLKVRPTSGVSQSVDDAENEDDGTSAMLSCSEGDRTPVFLPQIDDVQERDDPGEVSGSEDLLGDRHV